MLDTDSSLKRFYNSRAFSSFRVIVPIPLFPLVPFHLPHLTISSLPFYLIFTLHFFQCLSPFTLALILERIFQNLNFVSPEGGTLLNGYYENVLDDFDRLYTLFVMDTKCGPAPADESSRASSNASTTAHSHKIDKKKRRNSSKAEEALNAAAITASIAYSSAVNEHDPAAQQNVIEDFTAYLHDLTTFVAARMTLVDVCISLSGASKESLAACHVTLSRTSKYTQTTFLLILISSHSQISLTYKQVHLLTCVLRTFPIEITLTFLTLTLTLTLVQNMWQIYIVYKFRAHERTRSEPKSRS